MQFEEKGDELEEISVREVVFGETASWVRQEEEGGGL
jgi:hypothetical protein